MARIEDWMEEAAAELAEAQGYDPDDASITPGVWGWEHGCIVELGSEEWLVFEDADEAETHAIARLEQDLEDEPGIFDQGWLAKHMTMSDTDRRIMANEQADSYVDDLDDDSLIEAANLENDMEELDDALDDAEIDDDEYEEQKEALADRAREQLREEISSDVYDRLSDPLRYFEEEYGWGVEDIPSNLMSLDIGAAAQDAVDTDGVAHFLSGYDGNVVELGSGAEAYRHN